MFKIIKKILHYRVSELVGVAAILPITVFPLAANVNVNQQIMPAEVIEILSLNVHKNIKSITISGKSSFALKPVWLEDISTKQIVQLFANDRGEFVAVLDHNNPAAHLGPHEVVAYTGVLTEEIPYITSQLVKFDITDDYGIVLGENTSNVKVNYYNLSGEQLGQLRFEYRQENTSQDLYSIYSYWENRVHLSYWNLLITSVSGLIIGILFMRRWHRKKRVGKSFWSLGRGIYHRDSHIWRGNN
ncbi:MAG: hypothetical protein V1838_04300 [Patescibacteria group bacterium]